MLDHFMRILNNQVSYHPRDIKRNLPFNFIRCFFDEFIFSVVLERPPSRWILLFRIVTVIGMTYWVQNNVSQRSYKKHAEDWTYLFVFYFTSYAIQNHVCMTTIEEAYKS